MKNFKTKDVPLSECIVDWEMNVREARVESYDSENLRNDLAAIGQQTTAKVEKKGDKYYVLQGNRRIFNMQILAKQGVIDPKTAKPVNGEIKRDPENGRILPGYGKPFETVLAEVYENLTDQERIDLIFDQGTVRSLNRVELQLAAEKFFDAQYNERLVVIRLGDLLQDKYPPTRKIIPIEVDNGQDLLRHYRGVVQQMKITYHSPKVLRDAKLDQLRGLHKWPTKKDMETLVQIYSKEVDEDKTGQFNRSNPGPVFMARWKKYLEMQESAETNGTKPPVISMPTRAQVIKMAQGTESRIMKAVHRAYLRELEATAFVTLDKLCKIIEANMPPEQVKVLDDVFALGKETKEQPEPESGSSAEAQAA